MDEPEDGLDNLLDQIGMGRWQVLGLVANFLIWFVLAPHTIGSTLLNAPVPYKCLSYRDPDVALWSSFVNHSFSIYQLENVILQGNATYFDSKCLTPDKVVTNDPRTVVIQSSFNNTVSYQLSKKSLIPSCPIAVFNTSIFSSTIKSEWSLVCEKEGYTYLFQNLYALGLIVGCLAGGWVGDRLGRARSVLIGSIIHSVGSVIIAFTYSFPLLLVCRFVIGLTNLMILVPVVTLALETCPPKYRGPIGMGVGSAYSLGVAIFAAFGVFLRHWRHLYIATSFPAILLVPVAWFLDESPRWYLQVGKLDEATKTVINASKINRCKFEYKEKTQIILEEVMKKEKLIATKPIDDTSPMTYNRKIEKIWNKILSGLKTPEMRKINLICPLAWFLNEMIYYGIIFNANRFSSTNPFLYVALIGIGDGCACVLGAVGCYFGRKLTVAGSQLISSILILLVLAVPEEMKWLQWLFIMVGFLMCACASQALFVYTPELFPTAIRARGFAFSNLTGYVGTLLAPFIPDVLASYAWWVTNGTLGAFGLISFVFVMSLPETLGTPMCETILDVENRGKLKKERELKKIENKKAENSTNTIEREGGIDNVSFEMNP